MKADLFQTIRTLLAPVRQRVLLMISRAVVRVVMDDKQMQLLQISVLKDEVLDNVERFQNFGFTSSPKPGAEAILACVGGDRNHPIVIAVDDRRYRKINLAPGESAHYNSEGDYIWIKADGTIEIKCSGEVTIDSPSVHITGDLEVDGMITATEGVVAPGGVTAVAGSPTPGSVSDSAGDLSEMRSVYNSHHHPQSGGGNTSPPTEQMS